MLTRLAGVAVRAHLGTSAETWHALVGPRIGPGVASLGTNRESGDQQQPDLHRSTHEAAPWVIRRSGNHDCGPGLAGLPPASRVTASSAASVLWKASRSMPATSSAAP